MLLTCLAVWLFRSSAQRNSRNTCSMADVPRIHAQCIGQISNGQYRSSQKAAFFIPWKLADFQILLQVNQFDSKQDLIESVMASAHVPFFLDGRPFLKYREQLCWDGSFPDFFYFRNSDFLERDDSTLIVDYSMDEELEWSRGDFLKLRDYDEIVELMNKGYQYMKRTHESGSVHAKFRIEDAL
jgi:hypothetical protein